MADVEQAAVPPAEEANASAQADAPQTVEETNGGDAPAPADAPAEPPAAGAQLPLFS
jgi:hypothetical protein